MSSQQMKALMARPGFDSPVGTNNQQRNGKPNN